MMQIQQESCNLHSKTTVAELDKLQILKAFNDHFIEFFEDVERVFPDNKDIVSAKRAIMTFRKMNPRILILVFHNSVGRLYREHINNGNLNFFVEKDYTIDIQNVKNADVLIQKINALREPVNNMNVADQDKVISYLNNLVYLSDMFYEKV